MHIAFLSAFDLNRTERLPPSKLGHAGRCVAMADAIEAAGHRVTRIAADVDADPAPSLLRRVRRRLTLLLVGEELEWVEPGLNQAIARSIEGQLAALADPDAPFDAIVTTDTNLVAYLETDLPMSFWADTTYATLLDDYPGYLELTAKSRRQLLDLDRRGLEKCDTVFLASDWAIEGALEVYGLDRARTLLLELGANFEPEEGADVAGLVVARDREPVELVFVGTDWERKGGDRAVELLTRLRDADVPARLSVIGVDPAGLPDGVVGLGRLDLRRSEDAEKYGAALGAAHWLLLPSSAECFGHVLCEANAFGVPALATDVGGIPSVVLDGRNGFTAPLEGWAERMADHVERHWRAPTSYDALAQAARHEYETRLNWTVLGERLCAEIAGRVAR